MKDTEMIIFSADGPNSAVSYTYCTGVGDDPTADDKFEACYDSSYVINTNGTITLTATRPLECSTIANSYVVQLD